MNIDVIISLIEKEIDKIELLLSENNEELEFLDKVIVENSFTNVKDILNINTFDIVMAYLCINSKKHNYKEIKELLNRNKGMISSDDKIVRKLISYADHKEFTGKKTFVDKIQENLLKRNLDKTENIDITGFLELCDECDEHIFEILALAVAVEEMKENYQEMMHIIEEEVETIGIRVSKKNKRAIINEKLKEDFNVTRMSKTLNEISSYYHKLKTEEKQSKKELRKEEKNYNELLRIISNLESERVLALDYDKVLSLSESEEIQKEFLYLINAIQKKKYEELIKEYSVLSADNKLEVKAIFKEHDIDFNKMTKSVQNKVLVMNKEELKLLLKTIKEYTKDSELIDYLILNSNYEILKHVTSMIKTGILTLDFILNNKCLLSEKEIDNNNYYKLVEIIELFKEENINPHIFINDLGIYLSEVNVIKNNIKALKQYKLLGYLRQMNNYNLLTSVNLIEKIDILLELGYEKIIEEYLEILNRDITKIKKLYILKEMNLLPTDIDTLKEVLDNENFLNFTDNLDNYIFNIVDYRIDLSNIKLDEDIEEVNLDNNFRTIEIDDVILSTNRIERNKLKLKNNGLKEEEMVLYSYVLGSILTEEEYDKIYKFIKPKDKQITL